MRISIVQIVERGVPNKERLHLSVQAACNLSHYVVFDTERTADGTQILPIPKHVFWFEPCDVMPGDWVILYTKGGTPSRAVRSDGHTNFFFYWDQANVLWNIHGSCAVLLELNDWITSP
jgi:hypothetical protein